LFGLWEIKLKCGPDILEIKEISGGSDVIMKILFVLIAALILLFSLGVSGYITFYKIQFRDLTVKLLAFLTVSMATTAVTFIICLSIVWPPIKM